LRIRKKIWGKDPKRSGHPSSFWGKRSGEKIRTLTILQKKDLRKKFWTFIILGDEVLFSLV
jgi:hypothetical protein